MREYPQSYLIRFARGSCYLFALARAAEKLTGKELSAHNVLDVALTSRYIADDGYVRNAAAFLSEITDKKWTVTKTYEDAPSYKGSITIDHWSDRHGHDHFRLADWDSLYSKSQAEAEGRIIDRRIVSLRN